MLHSCDALDPVALEPAGLITSAFNLTAVHDYRSAARYIARLPYSRNANRENPLVVLDEGRATCSTKHALLRRLAAEQALDITLMIGIYEMNERNTPGVGPVLETHRLLCLPEAHCYLKAHGKRSDSTREIVVAPAEQISHFLHEEEITPEQIGAYKIELHRHILTHWMEQRGLAATHRLDELWRIREQCIAAISS